MTAEIVSERGKIKLNHNGFAQLQLPESYQTYQRSEGREERFRLADSKLYEEKGQMQRFVNGNVVFGM